MTFEERIREIEEMTEHWENYDRVEHALEMKWLTAKLKEAIETLRIIASVKGLDFDGWRQVTAERFLEGLEEVP